MEGSVTAKSAQPSLSPQLAHMCPFPIASCRLDFSWPSKGTCPKIPYVLLGLVMRFMRSANVAPKTSKTSSLNRIQTERSLYHKRVSFFLPPSSVSSPKKKKHEAENRGTGGCSVRRFPFRLRIAESPPWTPAAPLAAPGPGASWRRSLRDADPGPGTRRTGGAGLGNS